MKKSRVLLSVGVLVVLISIYFFQENPIDNEMTGFDIAGTKEYGPEIRLLFCPTDECVTPLSDLIGSSEKVHCAIYDLKLEKIISALKEASITKEVLLFIDSDNSLGLEFERTDNKAALMHNKFCIFDDHIVWTGSMNPTDNGAFKNNNNVIILDSKAIAAVYEAEFQELWNYEDDSEDTHDFTLNNKEISIYFCPEDWCANKVLAELDKAKTQIRFMTFSFTHDQIGEILLKKHKEGFDIEGIFESRGISTYSEYEKLADAGITVYKDTNPNTMHHKVFIIDDHTVITGSFNPTRNADERNDENMLIIRDKDIVSSFLEEYARISPTPQ